MKKTNLIVATILLLGPLAQADEAPAGNQACEVQPTHLTQPNVEAALATLVKARVLDIQNGVIVEKQGSALDRIKQSDRWTLLDFESSVVCF